MIFFHLWADWTGGCSVVKHFRPAFFRYDSQTFPADKLLIYALFLSRHITEGGTGLAGRFCQLPPIKW